MAEAKRICSIPGCTKKVHCRGLCPMHYQRRRKTGDVGGAEPLTSKQEGPCSVDGCDRASRTKGLCEMHYSRWKSYGDPGEAEPRRALKYASPCSVDGCERCAQVKGMCAHHYGNQTRHGHAVAIRDWPIEDRLERVGWDVTEGGCWEWRGARNGHGYGLLNKDRAHRLMWEARNGPIPDGLVIRHRCDNPPCLRPDHLEVGTKKQNSRDMVERGRSLAYATGRYDGVCVSGKHDVTRPGALKPVRSKGRAPYYACVQCDRERQARYQQRKKESA